MEYKAIWAQIYPHIDLVWFPLALLAAHRHQRVIVILFLAACMLMMRLLIELIESTGYTHGFLGLLHAPLLTRGLAVYSVFYALYLLIAFLSPGSFKVVLMAASITIFFAASVSAVLVMLL
jgi:hypothetical protein